MLRGFRPSTSNGQKSILKKAMKLTVFTAIFLWGAVTHCNKPVPEVPPCDEDLGYLSPKHHLANVRFLDENRSIDWFELYENLEERRFNTPAQKCIPATRSPSVEQQIERREHELKELR